MSNGQISAFLRTSSLYTQCCQCFRVCQKRYGVCRMCLAIRTFYDVQKELELSKFATIQTEIDDILNNASVAFADTLI